MTAISALRITTQILIQVALIGVIITCVKAGKLIDDTRRNEASVVSQAAGLDVGIKNDLAQIAAVGKVLSQVGAKERDAFTEQQAYYRRLTNDTSKLLVNANDAITGINKMVIPQVGVDLRSLDGAIASSGVAVGSIAQEAGQAISDADAQINNPDIREALAGVRSTSTNAAIATQELAATAQDGRKLADYYYKEITKPVTQVRKVAEFLIRTVGVFLGY